ncbi:LacI family DNA-binding transcriptional regulator [Bacillus massiliglaciei]|uniref:LacI family DNA-binding transcriptional regulator n=1 Tax=Bacillus massiliglaciei TaxID=1816693 RepID=UPI000A92704F|nr:LacI family DNA-binding transcriptional regulator [Bacillus massiliglaciei]
MSITIKDVAKKANVAPSTVSRVIHDSPSISERTKRKVRKVMQELGYHMNANARNLVTKSTKTIGIVMKNSAKESLRNPFFPEVIRGIGAFCHMEGYSLSLTTGESEEAIYEDVVKMVQGRRVDGMIVLYSKKDDKVVPYLLEQQFPFVLIGKPGTETGGITFIDNENVKAARDLTHFMIGLGHRKIAYFGGSLDYEVVSDRLRGYHEALEKSKISLPEGYVKLLSLNREEGIQALEELLVLPEFPTAFVAVDILYAVILLGALTEKGIKVPEQVSVVCFNNSEIAELTSPPVTTMDVHTYQLGYEAAKCVCELILDPKIMEKSVRIPTKIIKRESHQTVISQSK